MGLWHSHQVNGPMIVLCLLSLLNTPLLVFLTLLGMSFGFYELSVIHGYPCFLINDCIGHFGQVVMLFYWLGVYFHIFFESSGYQVLCVLNLIVYIMQQFLVLGILLWSSPLYCLYFYPWWCILVFVICDNGCGF